MDIATAAPAWPDLARLLAPRHIAAIGGREAAIVVRQCRTGGFSGPIWPVNPARAELGGVACYDSVAALPDSCASTLGLTLLRVKA